MNNKFKKIVCVAMAIMIAMSMMVMLPSCDKDKDKPKYSTPFEYLEYAIGETEKANSGKETDILTKAENGGSVEVDFGELLNTLTSFMLTPTDGQTAGDTTLKVKTYLAGDKSVSVTDIAFLGESANLNIFADKEKIIASSNLFKGNYGIKVNELFSLIGNFVTGLTTVENEEILETEETETYTLPQLSDVKDVHILETVNVEDMEDMIVDVDDIDGEEFFGDVDEFDYDVPEAEAGDSIVATLIPLLINNKELVTKYGKMAIASAEKNISATMTDKENGGKTVVLTLDNASLEKILLELGTAVKGDKEALEFCKQLGMEDDYKYEDFEKDVKSIADEVKFTLTVTVDTATGDIINKAVMKFDATPKGDKQGAITVTLDMTNKDQIKLSVIPEGAAKDSDFESFNATYSITENTDAKYAAKLTVETNGKSEDVATFTYDRASGEYAINVNVEVEDEKVDIQVNGKYTVSDGKIEITVDTVKALNIPLALNMKVTILAKDDGMPAFPTEYKNINEMSDDEFEALGQEIGESKFVGKVTEFIGSFFGGIVEEDWKEEEWETETGDEDWEFDEENEMDVVA